MPVCKHPIHGFRAPGGQVKFSRSGAYRDLPITVPCGQCVGCRLERSRQWAVRCMHEASMHDHNCFLTLTYDENHLPVDRSLDVRHWQLFAKRVRKSLEGSANSTFRFFHCGEYGDTYGRPHYHAAIFGQDWAQDRKFYKTQVNGDSLFTSPSLDKLWPLGIHAIGELTFESAAYVARYILKKVNGDQAEQRYGQKVDTTTGELSYVLKPEYITMSRRPGIGKSWIDKYMSEVYPRDEVIVRGRQCKPPKFYDQQLEKANPRRFQIVKVKRTIKQKEYNYDDLAVSETVQLARISHFSREIK